MTQHVAKHEVEDGSHKSLFGQFSASRGNCNTKKERNANINDDKILEKYIPQNIERPESK